MALALLAGASAAGAAGAQNLTSLLPTATAAPAAAPPAEQAPVLLRSPDRAIAKRLADLYGQVDGLKGVKATVKAGVVSLTGSVLTEQDAERAESIAQRVQGVVSVESQLTTEHRITRRLQPMFDRIGDMAQQTVSFVPLLFLAMTVFIAFWWMGRRITRATRLFKRIAPNAFIEALIEQFIRLGFIVIGLLAALSILGATALLGSLLGAAGLIGLAVGFAVRDTIENYLAGILLSIRQPFAPNDHVIIEDFDGAITRLTSRVTVITTWDGNEVQIPNATVYKANIINFSKTPDRRFDFELPLDLSVDASNALAITLGAAKSVEGVLSDPAPSVVIDRIEGSALVIKVFGWIDQGRSDIGKVKGEVIRCAKHALEQAGMHLAMPVQALRLLDPAAATAPRAARKSAGSAAKANSKAPSVKPAREDLQAIGDTRADDTIRAKIHAIRKESDDEDLLEPTPRRAAE